MSASISVVITHYRSPDVLLRCLGSITGSPSDRLGSVVVVDGEAGDDLGPRLAALHPAVRYVPVPTNVGFSALVNIGMACTDSPYVLVLNADVCLGADSLDALAAHLDATPACGLVAPALRNEDGSLQHSTFRFYRPSTVAYRRTPLGRTAAGRAEQERFLDRARRDEAVATGRPLEVDWVLGAAMAVRRTAVAQVGPMDAGYFLYFEDVDWCLRFWSSGWQVHYLPTTAAVHAHGRASARGGVLAPLLNPLTRTHIRSAVRYFARHGRSADPRAQHLAASAPGAARAAVPVSIPAPAGPPVLAAEPLVVVLPPTASPGAPPVLPDGGSREKSGIGA